MRPDRNQGEAAGPSPDRPQGWRFGGAWYNICMLEVFGCHKAHVNNAGSPSPGLAKRLALRPRLDSFQTLAYRPSPDSRSF